MLGLQVMSVVEKLRLAMSPKLCVVVLTRAGVIESGVPIFRGRGLMWDIPEAGSPL